MLAGYIGDRKGGYMARNSKKQISLVLSRNPFFKGDGIELAATYNDPELHFGQAPIVINHAFTCSRPKEIWFVSRTLKSSFSPKKGNKKSEEAA
jgi:hypothetical protein